MRGLFRLCDPGACSIFPIRGSSIFMMRGCSIFPIPASASVSLENLLIINEFGLPNLLNPLGKFIKSPIFAALPMTQIPWETLLTGNGKPLSRASANEDENRMVR
jgi:hypothetical protein